MIRSIFSVGGWTLLSRLTGFARDIMMAAVLGAGPVADAFYIAFRLPNHFRAIFAEGAFNTAFIPAYARVKTQEGDVRAARFADGVLSGVVVVQLAVLAFALIATPLVVATLAPGLADDPERFALTVGYTRITFPYLGLIAVVTLVGGVLNANQRFWAAASASILLNAAMVGTLSLAGWFATAGDAAAWGVLISGFLQVGLLVFDAERHGLGPRFALPRLDPQTRRFLIALGPAILGSAGMQLAIFADTIVASFLPQGAIAALFYAERIYQLPIGVIGIAAGIVLLPEMSRRIAAGDEEGARHAQARALELIILLALPFLAACLIVPEQIMRGLFLRGAFTDEAARAAAQTLAAYAIGLLPFVVLRAFMSPFYARGDTRTPVIATLGAAVVNIALKIWLMHDFAQVGLAFATSVGGWISLAVLIVFALRRGYGCGDAALVALLPRLALIGLGIAAALFAAARFGDPLIAALPSLQDEARLALCIAAGGSAYGLLVAVLVGPRRLKALLRP
ncbi:murein biosynthesis integral membrane protein MurJ [Ancylobacter defluvii]|uniref:Probable lipid II flippase MurJ n=1 Tax=Ancylobacter defluvii TaxID=1282440 RepID=A0A9W6JWC0_9HYPH|nr:murein biosynthesis integral membrane protein MurJ [Ancylobacter defluvii]MBS7587758.1 murein biosynthesis integral membrane protein MurJ [Ancylobacter defluvii]GLK82568.1 putative lipid II flippase MurJ [Ancylobacter defluvii]